MTARYREIANELRQAIEQGTYAPGTTLPTYDDLTRKYGVGSGVIREALAVLKADGLISVAKKRGITVRERGSRRRVERGSLVTRDPAKGYVFPAASAPDEPWQVHGRPRRDTVPIPERPAVLLGVDPESPVLRRRRVTSPTGEPPFQLVDTWIHPDAVADAPKVADAQTGPGGYIDRLEEVGHGPISWVEYMRVRMPTSEEAKLLEMPDSMPALEVARVGTSAHTKVPVEVTTCVIPADRVELVTRLRRAKSAHFIAGMMRDIDK
ncbi:GntR family transcriptional regulator [Nocardiopsis sediminis]|uniref:GntR family transcriptional regulator n=1 Tax=Nocardiopsis sediminis TaxID=1778267 RepID=A0ABV8FRS4_9ACTN